MSGRNRTPPSTACQCFHLKCGLACALTVGGGDERRTRTTGFRAVTGSGALGGGWGGGGSTVVGWWAEPLVGEDPLHFKLSCTKTFVRFPPPGFEPAAPFCRGAPLVRRTRAARPGRDGRPAPPLPPLSSDDSASCRRSRTRMNPGCVPYLHSVDAASVLLIEPALLFYPPRVFLPAGELFMDGNDGRRAEPLHVGLP